MDTTNLSVLDCTLRDGGYYNNWDFDSRLVSRYLRAMAESGIDLVEIGFRFRKKPGYIGPFGYTTDAFLDLLDIPEELDIGVMLNASDALEDPRLLENFNCRQNSQVSTVRIAAHLREVKHCGPIIEELKSLGYRIGLNVMQAGLFDNESLTEYVSAVADFSALDFLYFADSLGNMNSGDIDRVFDLFSEVWRGPIGIHAHDNMGRALDNTCRAIERGALWADATVLGMGRGAGNVAMENLLIRLQSQGCSRFNFDPVLRLALEDFDPLKRTHNWGSNSLYHLAALKGIHPTYIQHMLSEDRYEMDDILTVIRSLEGETARSYSIGKLKDAISSGLNQASGSWNASNWLAGEDLVLVAGGEMGKKHYPALAQLLESKKIPAISLNYLDGLDPKLLTAVAACHPARLRSNIAKVARSNLPLIAPISMLSDSERQRAPGIDILDYGASVMTDTLAARSNHCIIPFAMVLAYALCVAAAAGVSRIMAFGFDGYETTDKRHQDSSRILDLFRQSYPQIELIALTPTNYNVEQTSIYQVDC